MREIVLDTETTGLDPYQGHRLVEIGCVELVNRIPSGQVFHVYLNPERDMPLEAFNVHGLSSEFLSDKTRFADDRRGVRRLHRRRAARDPQRAVRYRLHQLRAGARRRRHWSRASGWSTRCCMARRKHPGVSNKLDELCKRYGIDNSKRTKHGALLDAELLAEVYLELIGARRASLVLTENRETIRISADQPRRQRAGAAHAATAARARSPRIRRSSLHSATTHIGRLTRLECRASESALSARPGAAERKMGQCVDAYAFAGWPCMRSRFWR